MRIRKSRLLLQSSDLRPEAEVPPFQPPNQSMSIGNIIRTWLFPKTTSLITEEQKIINQQQDLTNDEEEAFKVEEKSFTNCTGILVNNQDEDMSTKKLLQPSSSPSAQGSCAGGVGNDVRDLKRRKETLGESPNEEKASPETKSETNNNFGDNVGFEVNVINESTSGGTKRMKRGNVIMEGSRCSRVNGRGWRCCQATLVGYSLCEHHLGKGRLRSMASTVRRPHISMDESGATPLNGGEPKVVTKKRTKMLKARSLNSLLGQI